MPDQGVHLPASQLEGEAVRTRFPKNVLLTSDAISTLAALSGSGRRQTEVAGRTTSRHELVRLPRGP